MAREIDYDPTDLAMVSIRSLANLAYELTSAEAIALGVIETMVRVAISRDLRDYLRDLIENEFGPDIGLLFIPYLPSDW